jgi:hypothetical protein
MVPVRAGRRPLDERQAHQLGAEPKRIACRINLGEHDPVKIRDSALTELQLKK